MKNPIKTLAIFALGVLSGCATYTTTAMVKTSTGDVLVGKTTAAVSGGTFNVANSAGLSCSGTYNALDTSPIISVPLRCSDGRTGVVTVTRTPDGLSGQGVAQLSDGSSANVGFGSLSSSVTRPEVNQRAAVVSKSDSTNRTRIVGDPTCYTGPRGGTYRITSGGNKDYSACGPAKRVAKVAAKPQRRVSQSSRCFVGPRGGTYTITRSGRKNYSGC